MLELRDAKEYALTVFKTCKEVVSVNLTWRELDKLPYCSGYAIEATFVDGSVGRLSKIRGLFPVPLLVQYNPGDFNDENYLWMHVVEDLNMKSQDRNKGKKLNRLCNSFFVRNAFVNNLNKRCNIDGIRFLKVLPAYSSFIGNFLYRSLNLPDPILASIELGRRGYEFNAQYIEKTKEKSKTIVQPSLKKFDDLIHKSLEEFGIKESFKDLIDLYYLFKKDLKMMYRVPFAKDSKWSKLKTKKSYISKLDGFSLSSL